MLRGACTLTNSGLIEGGAGGVGGQGPKGFGAAGAAGAGVVAGAGAITVVDSGTIAGAAISVDFTSASDVLEAKAGAVFDGAILGGGGTFALSGGGMIANLGGAAGEVSGGVQGRFSGFSSYVLRGGGWTLTGETLLVAGASLGAGAIRNDSIITLDGGAVTIGGAVSGSGQVVMTGAPPPFSRPSTKASTSTGRAANSCSANRKVTRRRSPASPAAAAMCST